MNYIKSYHLFYLVIAYLIFATTGDFDFDYGFYQLLRFVAFFAFSFAAYASYECKQQIMPFVLGFIAIIFNPFIPIHMERGVWQTIDFSVALILLIWVSYTYNTKLYQYLYRLSQKFNRKFYFALGGASLLILLSVILFSFVMPFREEEPAAAPGIYAENNMWVEEYNEDPIIYEQSSSEILFEGIPNIEQDWGKDKKAADIDRKARSLLTDEGLTIGEVQEINARKLELGLPPLDNHTPVNPNRPFKSEAINDMYDPESVLNKKSELTVPINEGENSDSFNSTADNATSEPLYPVDST